MKWQQCNVSTGVTSPVTAMTHVWPSRNNYMLLFGQCSWAILNPEQTVYGQMTMEKCHL